MQSMSKFFESIKKNRLEFSKSKSISDQKNIDFSFKNVRLSEIVDLIIWFGNKNKDEQKKK